MSSTSTNGVSRDEWIDWMRMQRDDVRTVVDIVRRVELQQRDDAARIRAIEKQVTATNGRVTKLEDGKDSFESNVKVEIKILDEKIQAVDSRLKAWTLLGMGGIGVLSFIVFYAKDYIAFFISLGAGGSP